jgi:hypothetical protein
MRFEKSSGTVRQFIVASTFVLLAASVGACGSSDKKPASGNAGSTGAAGAGSGAAGQGASGSVGTAGGGGTIPEHSGAGGTIATGTAGATAGSAGGGGAGSGGGSTGTAGSSTAGSGGATGGGGSTATAGTTGAGGGMTMFSDDFEEYKIQGAFSCPANPPTLCDFIPIGSTTPTWLSYHFHGPPYVVALNVFGGKQVYQLDTEGGHPVAADIIKESPDGVDLWPAAHYGRFMVNLKGLPVTGSVGIMTESGLLPGSTTNTAQYTLGATDGKLSFSYMQRVRPFKNDVSTPTKRIGGNWENASEAPTTYCTVTATTATIAANKWVCVEWMIDRTKPELHVWLDGAAQAALDVTGGGGTCSAGTAPTWTGPAHFTELDLGWEINGNDAGGRGAQYDMFAIGTQKLGCPTP